MRHTLLYRPRKGVIDRFSSASQVGRTVKLYSITTMSPDKKYRRSRRTQVDHIHLNTGFTGIIIHDYRAVCIRDVSPWPNQFGDYHTSRCGQESSPTPRTGGIHFRVYERLREKKEYGAIKLTTIKKISI